MGAEVDAVSWERFGGAGKERRTSVVLKSWQKASKVGLQRDDGDSGCWPGPTSGPYLEATGG